MAAWMIPPAAAGDVFLVKSKQEGEAKCKEFGNEYGYYALYRDGPKGNDIHYSCGYRHETKTKLNRSNKCDPKHIDSYAYLQGTDFHYSCEDGKLMLMDCRLDDSDNAAGEVRSPLYNIQCKPAPGYQ
ncbi:hypothetical protein O0I10_011632 [Lichtheimia ornata]|uniref:Uncharacterized protein n=1 Tax=Lichtheimia ornata TaxID=688661 RepID=A0AAD7UT58_9FUNG|nr:uncharacterized protein O0I10_011632 [Lichtheimia ornata]KAJ8652750.1 hypothetical protein O0I10_011632 [Lichtheimia ornata]